jgi:NADH-quinone oxidoreductase subunit E
MFLLDKLRKAQDKDGFISEREFKRISKETGIPLAKVYGTATFYSMFHTKPQGKYIIEICNSPSCYVNGSLNIIKFIEKELGIKSNQTTKDGKFSLHICSCIGCCDQAPAMLLNKKVHGNLTKTKIKEIFKQCK